MRERTERPPGTNVRIGKPKPQQPTRPRITIKADHYSIQLVIPHAGFSIRAIAYRIAAEICDRLERAPWGLVLAMPVITTGRHETCTVLTIDAPNTMSGEDAIANTVQMVIEAARIAVTARNAGGTPLEPTHQIALLS